MKRRFAVEIEFSRLKRIAEYYEFPVAVFLADTFPEGTRKESIIRKLEQFKEAINKVMDEFL